MLGIIAGESPAVKDLQGSISWYMLSARIAILLPLSLIEFTPCSIQTRQLPPSDGITIARPGLRVKAESRVDLREQE